MQKAYKKNYHPLTILVYNSKMLDAQQLKQLPKTTKHNWNSFKHENYDGYEMVLPYIKQFDDIKDVFSSQYTKKAIQFLLKTRRGYYQMLGELQHNKSILKLHASSIIQSVEDMATFAKVNVTTACKYYGISKDWYYTQKRKVTCTLSPINKCYRQYTNQLAFKEITTIEHIVKKPENARKPLSTIYFDAIRKQYIVCGLTTFRKYAKAFGFVKQKPIKAERKKGFKASYVFEWLHIDITNVQTQYDGVQKVAFVKDNFSSALLHVKSTTQSATSQFMTELLQETFEKYQLFDLKDPINILSDGGSENKGEVISWVKSINAPPIVKKITAMTDDFPFSNAMSESTHKIYKSEFMGGKYSENETLHLKSLNTFMNYYNYERYPCRLYGKTPMEIVNGQTIDKHLFSELLKQAKMDRVDVNRNFNNCIAKLGCGVS